MSAEERLDEALDAVLKAAGASLAEHLDNTTRLEKMQQAMRKIMIASYIAGSNACFESLKANKYIGIV